MNAVTRKAPAKINLGLDIVGRVPMGITCWKRCFRRFPFTTA